MSSDSPSSYPPVSVVLVTRDDRRFVRDCLDSLLEQDAPLHEVIVMDGGSRDGTPDVVASMAGLRGPNAMAAPIRLVQGGSVTEAQSLATGDVLCLVDARARYASDAVRLCVESLGGGHGPVAGRARAVGTTSFGRAAAAVSRWLPADGATPICWGRSEGGTGTPTVVDARVRSWWYAPEGPVALAKEAFEAGAASADRGLRDVPARVSVPALAVILLVAARGWRRAAVVAVYGSACAALAVRAGRDPGVAPHRAAAALVVGHVSAAAGLARGLLR